MSAFPVLKTGAVAQYPAQRTLSYATHVVRFVDGSEQRYREYATPLHRWVIRLDLLDEKEMAKLEEFFVSQQGTAGTFSFTDPWDQAQYANCSIENREMVSAFLREGWGRTTLVVRENRS